MSLSQVMLRLLKQAELFGYLPEPYNHKMTARQTIRRSLRIFAGERREND